MLIEFVLFQMLRFENFRKFGSAYRALRLLTHLFTYRSIFCNYLPYLLTTRMYVVWFEPTDVSHIWKLSESDVWKNLTFTSPNFAELQQMVASLQDSKQTSTLGL